MVRWTVVACGGDPAKERFNVLQPHPDRTTAPRATFTDRVAGEFAAGDESPDSLRRDREHLRGFREADVGGQFRRSHVDPAGLEPATPALQTQCATSCAKGPHAAERPPVITRAAPQRHRGQRTGSPSADRINQRLSTSSMCGPTPSQCANVASSTPTPPAAGLHPRPAPMAQRSLLIEPLFDPVNHRRLLLLTDPVVKFERVGGVDLLADLPAEGPGVRWVHLRGLPDVPG